ncbi:6489_t:CDS:1, partial [Funneliformis geosporum]
NLSETDSNNESDNEHKMYRNEARKKLKNYRKNMEKYMKSKQQKSLKFKIGDIVTLRIPVKDRSKTDRPNLPCKIIEKLYKNYYKLGCKSGILNISYNGSNLEPMSLNNLSELDNIPNNTISVREASRLQNISEVEISDTKCNCKKTFCSTFRCICKKSGKYCNVNCHPGEEDCNNPP